MKITRTSIISGITRTLDIDVTQEQLDEYAENERVIGAIFPNISIDEREFIKSGITDEEWQDMFKEDEDGQQYEL